jgi:hypothetical protein
MSDILGCMMAGNFRRICIIHFITSFLTGQLSLNIKDRKMTSRFVTDNAIDLLTKANMCFSMSPNLYISLRMRVHMLSA